MWIIAQADDNLAASKLLSENGFATKDVIAKDLVTDSLFSAIEIRISARMSMPSQVKKIERLCDYKLRLFNADLGPEQMFMFSAGLSPLSEIEYEINDDFAKNIHKIGQADVSTLTVFEAALETEYDPLRDFDCRLTCAVVGEERMEGDERDILARFKKAYDERDPDVFILEAGDRWAFEYLMYRSRKNGIDFVPSRERQDLSPHDGKSYFSYGHIIRRNPHHYLKGRFHIDSRDFMYKEAGMDGIAEIAAMTYLPVQKVARLSPGAAITNLYVCTAYRMGYPIPYKSNMVEDFKTARQLLEADKGGFIYEPRIGFHNDVAELDFASLYPHIMVRYNISPETVLCPCCAKKNKVPYAGYHICERRVGLVPKILAPIIERRMELKELHRRTGCEEYGRMANALKWMLVTSFGYMGYRKSRFARIEAHECITSIARHILLESTKIAEDMGFEVLHGIVDSLWVTKDGMCDKDIKALARTVTERFQIPFEPECRYKWIVFLPSVNSPITPVPNRYYGILSDGKAKVRGIELRRRDAPCIVKEFQADAIGTLSGAQDMREFMERVPQCMSLLRIYGKRLAEGAVDRSILAIRQRVSRSPKEYRGNSAAKTVLEQLLKEGIEKHPGECIEYVIRDIGSKDPRLRYTPASILRDERYDTKAYIALLVRSLESLLCGFGYKRGDIADGMCGSHQSRLSQF